MSRTKLTVATRPRLGVVPSPRGVVDASLVATALGGVPLPAGGHPARAHAGVFIGPRKGATVATQRLTLATLAGDAAGAVSRLFARWHAIPDPAGVDRFGTALRENAFSPPVVYFAEWVDGWSMGDNVPGPNAVQGNRYQAACFLPAEAIQWAATRSEQFPEYRWLAARLREAATWWGGEASGDAVVVLRDVFETSRGDDDVTRSLSGVPPWLSEIAGG